MSGGSAGRKLVRRSPGRAQRTGLRRGEASASIARMNRPERQLSHLTEKIAEKESRSRKRGKRAKRWRKWIETYKGLTQTGEAGGSEATTS